MKIKLANGNKYSITKASETFDVKAFQKSLEVTITGDNTEANFRALVTDLHDASNLKNVTIERETQDIVFADVELLYSSLNIFESYTEGFLVLGIIENEE